MKRASFAISPEINVGGPMFTAKDLIMIGELVGSEGTIELTNLQQLIVKMNEEEVPVAMKKIQESGLCVYHTGSVVKNLSVCAFCKGAEIEGLDVARQINTAIAGIEVPFTLRVGYTGCPNACGEPMVKDIGIVKRGDLFEIYLGGQSKTLDVTIGQLLIDQVDRNEIIHKVLKVIELYQKEGKKREKFNKFINRYGMEMLRTAITL
ncbi:nitrite reductase [Brevibacillus ginsengisoli]|uniref:nitrite reductase n=1 Tax=Brevibacillus ginsengisoli TaxID=363854 RepID=UPI003CEC0DFD